MRFPLRLTAELTKAKIVRMRRGNARRPIILRVLAPADASEDSSKSPISNSAEEEAILEQVKLSGAPVVWIGEAGPLAYSGVGHLTRRIADLGRTVFVETDGVLLRRRIFSFRPGPQVFITVQLDGTEGFHDRRAGRNGVYRAAMEGIRAARLSGFMICAKTTVYEDTELRGIVALRKIIETLGLDGWVVTRAAGVPHGDAMETTLEAAREMSGTRWAAFSRLVEAAIEKTTLPLSGIAGVSSVGEPREEAYEQEVHVP